MELIQKYITTTNENNIVLSNIPSTYRHLSLQAVMKTNVSTVSVYHTLVLNSDTGANYGRQQIYAYGNGTGASNFVNIRSSVDSRIESIGVDDNNFSYAEHLFADYKGSTAKNIITRGGGSGIGGTAASNNSAQTFYFAHIWTNTNAITSIRCTATSGDYAAGTTFLLWGLE